MDMKKYESMKWMKCLGAMALLAAALPLRAATVYIGDAYAYGRDLPDNTVWSAGDGVGKVTFAFVQPDTTYVNVGTAAVDLRVTEVNFYSLGVASGDNFVRPFLAVYSGDLTNDKIKVGTNYEIKWLGADIPVVAGAGVRNLELDGEPVVSLAPGEILVAGYYAQDVGGMIRNNSGATTVADLTVLYGTLASGVGDTLLYTANSPNNTSYMTLNRTMAFNLGLELVLIPEPSTAALLVVGSLGVAVTCFIRRRRQVANS
jgi:hypothetical protein